MRNQRFITAATWFFLLLFPLHCLGQMENIQPVSERDHYRHPLQDRFYTENWNYHFVLDNGEFLSLTFAFSNLGVTSGSVVAQMTLSRPGLDPLIVKDELSQSSYSENPKTGVISMGADSISLNGNVTRLAFSKDGISADLTVRHLLPGFQVADGKTCINKEKGQFYTTFIEIPRADLEGTLTIKSLVKPVKGAGYMDHNYSNVLPTSYSSNWCSLRAFLKDYTISLLEFHFLPGAGGGRWALGYVADKEKLLGVSTNYEAAPVEIQGDKSCPIPAAFAVHFASGAIRIDGSFKSRDEYCCTQVLKDYNWAARKVLTPFVGNPLICRTRSNADLTLQLPDRTLHLEGPAYQGVVQLSN